MLTFKIFQPLPPSSRNGDGVGGQCVITQQDDIPDDIYATVAIMPTLRDLGLKLVNDDDLIEDKKILLDFFQKREEKRLT